MQLTFLALKIGSALWLISHTRRLLSCTYHVKVEWNNYKAAKFKSVFIYFPFTIIKTETNYICRLFINRSVLFTQKWLDYIIANIAKTLPATAKRFTYSRPTCIRATCGAACILVNTPYRLKAIYSAKCLI